MKKLLVATLLASVSGHLYAQAPAAETAPAQAPAVETAAPAPAQPAAPVIKVEKIVTAAGIEKKEPVSESSAFDKDTAKVYTWTRIVSDTVPAKVKHVYYLNEKKAGEIEIAVNGSPWRIWSAKNVRPGSWKVDVTDENDKVLSSVVFTVSETANAPAPAAEAPQTEAPKTDAPKTDAPKTDAPKTDAPAQPK